ncbi:MAG: hypothetical protein ACOVQX_07450 [Legionella sp.]
MQKVRIDQFIQDVHQTTNLEQFDRDFVSEISGQFTAYSHHQSLTKQHFNCLLNIFKKRWELIVDTTYDYTRSQSLYNTPWMALASDLSNVVNKTVLDILIPQAKLVPSSLSRAQTPLSSTEPYHYILSDDNKTLYDCRCFLIQSSMQQGAMDIEFSKKLAMADKADVPWSLKELNRLRSKIGPKFKHADIDYTGYWHYIIKNHAQFWLKKGQVFRVFLESLLEAMDFYFSAIATNGNVLAVKDKLIVWSNFLLQFHARDVNFLYGQIIVLGTEELLFADLLCDCLSNDLEKLSYATRLIAAHLASMDRSLISTHAKLPPLANFFWDNKLGPYFDKSALINGLMHLDDKDRNIREKIATTLASIKKRTGNKIDQDIVSELALLYKQRWLTVIDTQFDYTRYNTRSIHYSLNRSWIVLAQLMCGAGLIPDNYYRFLMPTLLPDFDKELTYREYLINYPLDHFIVSESNQSLICLLVSERYYYIDNNHLFLNYYPGGGICSQEFSPIEVRRLEFANERFKRFVIAMKEPEPSLKLSTLMAIKELVNADVHFEKPPPAREEYKEVQEFLDYAILEASQAYEKFCSFVNKLPPDEKENLYKQRISGLLYHRVLSVSGILTRFTDEGFESCFKINTRYFRKLFIDYLPYYADQIRFDLIDEGMVFRSSKKVVSDYKFEYQETIRRLEVLLFSIMTHKFEYFSEYFAYPVAYLEFRNFVAKEAAVIHEIISPLFIKNDFQKAGFVYGQLMLSIIKPSLESFTWGRYESTTLWLTTISNNKIFTTACSYRNPAVILSIFMPFVLDQSKFLAEHEQLTLLLLLNSIARIFLSNKNCSTANNIEFNILLKRWIDRLPLAPAEQLKKLLLASPYSHNPSVFYQQLLELLAHRFASIALPSELDSNVELFSNTADMVQIYTITKLYFGSQPISIRSIDNLIDFIANKLKNIESIYHQKPVKPNAIKQMDNYWFSMTSKKIDRNQAIVHTNTTAPRL